MSHKSRTVTVIIWVDELMLGCPKNATFFDQTVELTNLTPNPTTVDCEKIEPLFFRDYSANMYPRRFWCSILNIQRVIQEKQGV